ncbi:MAG: protein NosL [Myxococcaceae bacterium]|nr:protein NosL [Myxococcaceae bacterium]
MLSLLMLVAAACHKEPAKPVEPEWGKQACAQCGMQLEQAAPSAQALLPDDTRKFFEDVGCMADWLNESGAKLTAAWVYSPGSKVWGDALTAHYEGGHQTPMGFGFVAAEQGLTFRELRIVARERPKSPSNKTH